MQLTPSISVSLSEGFYHTESRYIYRFSFINILRNPTSEEYLKYKSCFFFYLYKCKPIFSAILFDHVFTSLDYLTIQSTDQVMQRCTNPWRQVARATKLCTMLPNIFESWVWNLLYDIFLAPRIWGGFQSFGKLVHTRGYVTSKQRNTN